MILAIDPGTTESAWVLYDDGTGLVGGNNTWKGQGFAKSPNDYVLDMVRTKAKHSASSRLVIEMIASYGMPVGAEVFETCVWIGRFIEAWNYETGCTRTGDVIYRREVKLHLCGQSRAKDANIRQALIDRFGPGKDKAIGKKATPGPLYGVTADVWAALAVAVTYADAQLKARAA